VRLCTLRLQVDFAEIVHKGLGRAESRSGPERRTWRPPSFSA
jgi:hypothetical protein